MTPANPFKAFAPYWVGYEKRVAYGIFWLFCTQVIALSMPMLLKWAVDTIEGGVRGMEATFITGAIEGDIAFFAVLVAVLALLSSKSESHHQPMRLGSLSLLVQLLVVLLQLHP